MAASPVAAATALFKARHRHLVFGGFALTKEKEIAEALDEGALIWASAPDGMLGAVAIARYSKVDSTFMDYAGAEFSVPEGTVRVSEFTARDTHTGKRILHHLVNKAGKRPVWLEIFEEDEVAKASLAEVPALRYVTTKVMGGSELKGLYSTDPPYMAERGPAETAALAVLREGYLDAEHCYVLAAEADALGLWEDHYSTSNKAHSWSAMALRGYDPADPHFICKPAEMPQAWRRDPENAYRLDAVCDWTVAAKRCPETMAVVHSVLRGNGVDRVRYMRLTPDGELTRHADIADRDAGVADGKLSRLHIPLRTNPFVTFHGWDKRGHEGHLKFPLGALCYLDQRGPHRVDNPDPSHDRIHLVIDMQADAMLRTMIATAKARV